MKTLEQLGLTRYRVQHLALKFRPKVREIVTATKEPRKPGELRDIVLDAVRKGHDDYVKVAEATGIEQRDARRSLDRLAKSGAVRVIRKGVKGGARKRTRYAANPQVDGTEGKS